MPIHVTTSTTQSLSNKTFVDKLSTTGVVYSNSGNSNQWNSTYSNIQSNSASWNASITGLNNNGNEFALNSDGTFSISNNTISTGVDDIQLYSGTGAAITWYNPAGGGPGVDFLSRAQATTGAVKFTFLNGAPPSLTSKQFVLSSDGRFVFTDNTIQYTAFTGTATDTDVRALTSNWQNTYTNFSTQSGKNNAVYSSVNAKSANWDNTYTDFSGQSGRNAAVYSTVNSKSASWDTTYTSFNAQSGNNASVYSNVNSKSANWDNTYSGFSSQSASNAAVYSSVNTKSASWDITYTGFSTQSANNTSVYSTVQTNSSTWTGGGSQYVPASYTRWALTGASPTVAFSIPGATSSISAAYRVTVDYLLQDPNSYTIDNTADTITFSQAPPTGSEIIVLEETFSQVTAGDGAKWNSTYTTVNTNSATWSAPAASSITGTRLASNVVGSSLTQVGVLTALTTTGLISSNYVGNTDSSLIIAGSNTKGGAGYHDFLRVTNGASGVTNPNKYFRLNSTGELQILNSAYNAQLFNLDNSGNVTIAGNLSATGGQVGYSAARPGFRVYGSGTTNNLTTTQNGDGKLNSNNFATDFNQGSHLNTSTGVFTAPFAGLYQVNVVGRNSGYSSGISQIACLKNSSVIIMVEWAASSTMNHAGGSSVVYLASGDTLTLKVLAGQINFDGNDNWSVAYIG